MGDAAVKKKNKGKKSQEDQAGEVPAPAPSLGSGDKNKNQRKKNQEDQAGEVSGEKKKKPVAAADKVTPHDVSIFVLLTDSLTD